MTYKRILSLLLAVVIVFQLAYIGEISAAPPPSPMETAKWVSNMENGGGENLLPGEIQLREVVEKTQHPNKYKVTLQLESMPYENHSNGEIVILLDSGSYTASQMAKRVGFLQDILPQIITEESGNKVALVATGHNAEIVSGLVGSGELDTLLNKAETITPTAGLNLEKGLRVAAQLFTQNDNDKLLLILSDGKASRSSKVAGVETQVSCSCPIDITTAVWDIKPNYTSPEIVVGSGDSITSGLFSNRININDYSCSLGSLHSPPVNRYPSDHGDTAIYESGIIKNSGIIIEALCESPHEIIRDIVSGNGIYTSQSDAGGNLKDIFKSTSIPAFGAGEVKASYSHPVVPETSSIYCEGGVAKLENGSLIWQPEQSSLVSFYAELDVESPYFKKDTQYSPLEGGVFSYTAKGEDKTLALNQNHISGYYIEIKIQGVLCDSNGNYLDSENTIVDSPKKAHKLTPATDWNNSQGVNRWSPLQMVMVRANLEVPQGYRPLTDDMEKVVDIPADGKDAVVYFKYVKNPPKPATYTLTEKYYLDDNILDEHTLTTTLLQPRHTINAPVSFENTGLDKVSFNGKSIANGTQVQLIEDYENIAEYFYILPAEPEPSYSYSICYYKNNQLVDRVEKTSTSETVTINVDTEMYKGYELKYTEYNNEQISQGELISLSKDKSNIIHVFFEKEKQNYIVEHRYYLEEGYLPSDTERFMRDVQQYSPVVDPDKYGENIKFERIVFGADEVSQGESLQLSYNEDNIFHIYYVYDNSGEEDPTPKPEYYKYTIMLYQNGVTEKTENYYTENGTLTISIDKEYYTGWNWVETLFNNRSVENGEVVSLESNRDNIIKVYYTKEEAPPIDDIEYHYKILFYKDGLKVETEKGSSKNQRFLLDINEEKYSGYIFDGIKFGEGSKIDKAVQVDLSEHEENLFYVYYVKEENTTPPLPLGDIDVPLKNSFGGTEVKSSFSVPLDVAVMLWDTLSFKEHKGNMYQLVGLTIKEWHTEPVKAQRASLGLSGERIALEDSYTVYELTQGEAFIFKVGYTYEISTEYEKIENDDNPQPLPPDEKVIWASTGSSSGYGGTREKLDKDNATKEEIIKLEEKPLIPLEGFNEKSEENSKTTEKNYGSLPKTGKNTNNYKVLWLYLLVCIESLLLVLLQLKKS